MMLIFQKKCGRLVGEGVLKIRTCEQGGDKKLKWAKICGRPLWMAPYYGISPI